MTAASLGAIAERVAALLTAWGDIEAREERDAIAAELRAIAALTPAAAPVAWINVYRDDGMVWAYESEAAARTAGSFACRVVAQPVYAAPAPPPAGVERLERLLDAMRENLRQNTADFTTTLYNELWAIFSTLSAPPPADAVRALVDEAMDKGPWRWKRSGVRLDIYSDDFARDVALRVSGDFVDMDEMDAYGQWLADTLNARPYYAAAAPTPEGGFTDNDAYTLIGHAEVLRGQGETDMPAYFFDLAARVALAFGDRHLADRVREMGAAAAQQEGGRHG